MKVTIHITHTEADDLAQVEAAARQLGLDVTSHGGFMGRRHTELAAEMDPATLAALLEAAPRPSAAAA
jgi:hypothetical protein